MDIIHCACGTDYRPKDATAVKRHEATAKHQAATLDQTEWDLDFDEIDEIIDTPVEEEAPIAKPKKVRVPKTVNVGEHKKCRICGEDKPLAEYRKKSSRPDGKDTMCILCSRKWTANIKAGLTGRGETR